MSSWFNALLWIILNLVLIFIEFAIARSVLWAWLSIYSHVIKKYKVNNNSI